MQKVLHSRDDVDRIYVLGKEGGRGLPSTEDSVDASIQRLEDYIEKHEGGLVTAIRNDTDNIVTNRMTIIRKQKWEEKTKRQHFTRENLDVAKKKNLKREIESLLVAAQNNVIKINHMKARIDKTQQNSKCRLCIDRDEIMNRIISECSKLAQE